jgi:hypothetical protein
VEEKETIIFYAIDDHILLRRGKLGPISEYYTRDGWKVWHNSERFWTEAEEITEDEARALLTQIKKRFEELDRGKAA